MKSIGYFFLGLILLAVFFMVIDKIGIKPPDSTLKEPVVAGPELSLELSTELAEYLQLNFGGTSWYEYIEEVGVYVNMQKRTFAINVKTIIYPDSDAAQPAQGIAGALMSWARGIERDKKLTLNRLAVYGEKAGQMVELRTWDDTFGWRNQ